MNKKKIIIIVISVVLISAIIVGILVLPKKNSDGNQADNSNIVDKEIVLDFNNADKKYSLEKVEIINSKLVCKEKICNILITLDNPLPDDIDLSNEYKIFVYDNSDVLLTIIDGTALGKIDANSSLLCNMKLDYDKETIGKVIIKKNN